jgi:hypothetical protein
MHSIGKGVRDASRSVLSKDAGLDSKKQLLAVLGRSAVLRNRGRDRQVVLVAEHSSTSSICRIADSK